MKPVYFCIRCAIVTHPDQWTIAELNKCSSLTQLIEKFRFCKKKDTADSLITTSGYIKRKENGFDSVDLKMKTFE